MINDEYICHYGVKGMRWGVRKAEVRSDNRKASMLGKKATYEQHAYEAAKRRADKYSKKYKDSTNEKQVRKLKAAIKNRNMLKKSSEKSTADVKKHYNSLVKKYGKENVKDIKYDKRGFLNEGKDLERSLISAGATGIALGIATAVGLPFTPVAISRTSGNIGNQMEARSYRQIYRDSNRR